MVNERPTSVVPTVKVLFDEPARLNGASDAAPTVRLKGITTEPAEFVALRLNVLVWLAVVGALPLSTPVSGSSESQLGNVVESTTSK